MLILGYLYNNQNGQFHEPVVQMRSFLLLALKLISRDLIRPLARTQVLSWDSSNSLNIPRTLGLFHYKGQVLYHTLWKEIENLIM